MTMDGARAIAVKAMAAALFASMRIVVAEVDSDTVALFQRGHATVAATLEPKPAPMRTLQGVTVDNVTTREPSTIVASSCFNADCQHWTDTQNQRIEAHGGGFLQDPATKRWYWYGESTKTKDDAGHGVTCYSAPTLAGPWTNHGMILSQGAIRLDGHDAPWIVERPKVLYNQKTRKYVLWFHLDKKDPDCCYWGPRYILKHVGVATADRPEGPFTFVHAFQPDGIPSLDMSLFKDTDGTAYFIRSCNNNYTGISRLSSDYLTTTGLLSRGPLFEGMALFRLPNGTLYMMSSHLTGWKPNPLMLKRSYGPSLADPQWADLGNPTNDRRSYNTQPTYVVPYTTKKGFTYFIYMADNWIHAGKHGLVDAGYVWLPIELGEFPSSDCKSARLSPYAWWDLEDPFNNSAVVPQSRLVTTPNACGLKVAPCPDEEPKPSV